MATTNRIVDQTSMPTADATLSAKTEDDMRPFSNNDDESPTLPLSGQSPIGTLNVQENLSPNSQAVLGSFANTGLDQQETINSETQSVNADGSAASLSPASSNNLNS